MRLLLLLAGAVAAFAQAPSPAPSPSIPTLRITVTLVQIDAVVTDSNGRHIMDLGPGDFEILQDGQPQPVSFFTRMPAPPAPPAAGVLAGGVPAPITSTALTSAAQVRRAIALVVDDLALSFQDLVRTREALKRYIETRMQPGDLVAIVRTGGGIAILEQFTTDRRTLLESAASLKWRFSGRQGLMAIRPNGDDNTAPRRNGAPEYLAHNYTLSALGALGTIEQVIQGMKAFPGRKSVVFFSDNLRVDGSIHAALDRITDLANRSMVSIYAVDPGGLNVKDLQRDPVMPDRDIAETNRFPGFPGAELDDETARQEGMQALAARTGGLFYRNRNDVEAAVSEAADDQLGYYLLGYSPQEGTFDAAGRGKFHKVTVRVRRPGLKVRWKSGFNGVPDQLELTNSEAAPKTREQQILEALASPFKASGIKVRLTSMYLEPKQLGPVVNSLLHFEAKDIGFTHVDSGWRARLDLVWTAYSGINQPMWQGQRPIDLRLTDQEHALALRDGVMMPITMRTRQPGTFLLRAVVRDTDSERIGSASQYVDVPDTRKGRFGMSGVLLRQATADLINSLGATERNFVQADDSWTQGGPALRRFRPGQGIVYAFEVINPKRKGSEKKSSIVSFVRVFRNGELLYTGPEQRRFLDIPGIPEQLQGGGLLRLGAQLSPGEYLIQVIVRDENGKKKAPPLTQWIDFEVVS
jgi:VWFA-related protein